MGTHRLLHVLFSTLLLCVYVHSVPDVFSSMVGTASHAHDGNETDKLSLVVIKDQLIDPMGILSSWNNSVHFCQWKGVSCSRRHHRVTMIDLSSQGVSGFISPSIGNLSFLRLIDFSNNSFRGKVPEDLGRLRRLQVLVLTHNSLEGQIPSNLSSCFNLRILRLSGNNFTGQLPFELGSLKKLVRLGVSENNLKETIPFSFGNLSTLDFLDLTSNQLEGRIPESLGQLKSLTRLYLGNNMFSGLIPQSIYNLSLLTALYLPSNELQGQLPENLGLTLRNIAKLSLWMNKLSGNIPASLSNASNLVQLDLSINRFSGGVPGVFANMKELDWLGLINNYLGSGKADDLSFITSLTNCSNLRILFLAGNSFGGVLPHALANLSTILQYLGISANEISGSIPPGIGNLIGLKALNLQSNKLTGTLPESIGKLHRLREFGVGKNKLSGDIPFSIGNLTFLTQLWLEENNFQGNIPSSLVKCQYLFLLHLHGNALTGSIPIEVLSLRSLSRSLKLSWNQLSGSLPLEIGNLKNLAELDLSKNRLSGKIPRTLGGCTRLERLYMNDNLFNGTILDSLRSLRGIEEIDLSKNKFSGEILKDFGSFIFLRKLNLSFNDFDGEVPTTGVFSNSTAISLIGNKKLCGGIPELQLPICSSEDPRKQKMSLALKLIVFILCGILGLTLLSCLLIYWCKKERNQASSASFSIHPLLNISYGDLVKATDGFSAANLIGTGSFSSVYKGILEQDQTIVAVKVLNLQRRGASKSFMAECEALRNIRHRNLVRVITACSGVNYHGDDFKALVYEFMSNGSLETWLHPSPQPVEPRSLSLSQRLNIVIDIATALDYLHNHCEEPIVHHDLKPSNILLDDDMTAHVGDFGLSEIITGCNIQVFTNQTTSSGLRGTIGYAAPEYGTGNIGTTQGDVYSFGIVLLEAFTGKRPTDDMFKDGLNLHDLVKASLPERLIEIVDRTLLSGGEQKQAAGGNIQLQLKVQIICGCLTSILKVGVCCSLESPTERMNIYDAVKELQAVKDLLFGNRMSSLKLQN